MKRWLLLIFGLTAIQVNAQTLNFEGDELNWEANVVAGLNNDGYEFGFGIACFADPCIGLKVSIGFAGEIEELEDWDWLYDDYNYYDTDHDYCIRFKFNPALVLRTPRLMSFDDETAGLHLFAEPGLVLSPGAAGSRGARTFCWDFKGGINLQIDRIIVTAGYGASNFSLYSGDPYSHWGSPKDYDYTTHFGFLGLAFKF